MVAAALLTGLYGLLCCREPMSRSSCGLLIYSLIDQIVVATTVFCLLIIAFKKRHYYTVVRFLLFEIFLQSEILKKSLAKHSLHFQECIILAIDGILILSSAVIICVQVGKEEYDCYSDYNLQNHMKASTVSILFISLKSKSLRRIYATVVWLFESWK